MAGLQARSFFVVVVSTMLIKGNAPDCCFIFPVGRIKTEFFYQALFISLDPRPDFKLFLLWSNMTLPLTSVERVPLSPTTGTWAARVGQVCKGENNVAAKPSWKNPNPAVVGSRLYVMLKLLVV